VVLAWKARDAEGALLAPAPLVAWLARGKVTCAPYSAAPLVGHASSAHESRLRRLARGEIGEDDRDNHRRAEVELARESYFEIAGGPEALHGKIALDPDAAKQLASDTGAGDRPIGITSIEHLADCAFRGFAEHVLRARPRVPRHDIPDPLESGTILHAALAAAFIATRDLWGKHPRDAERIRALALAAADAHLRSSTTASVLRGLAIDRIRASVSRVLEWSIADESWSFTFAEQSFGDAKDGSWPALVLDDGATRVTLRGAIDRVDVGKGGTAVRAIDYKSSERRALMTAKALGDTTFQVALYARVAADALHAVEREGRYVAGTVPDKTPRDYDAHWKQIHAAEGSVTRLEAKALQVVREVREGIVAPQRDDEDRCVYCDQDGGCRRPRFSIPRPEEDDT
jgi:RecB family exonuclease